MIVSESVMTSGKAGEVEIIKLSEMKMVGFPVTSIV